MAETFNQYSLYDLIEKKEIVLKGW
jgi:hypothetical protein